MNPNPEINSPMQFALINPISISPAAGDPNKKRKRSQSRVKKRSGETGVVQLELPLPVTEGRIRTAADAVPPHDAYGAKPKVPPLDYLTNARFWSKVRIDDPSGCWIWQGAAPGKYGQIEIMQNVFSAHRVAYYLATNVWPGENVVRHTCHETLCVNPAHLATGTQADNVKDRVLAGRSAFGKRNGAYTRPEKKRKGETHGMTHPNMNNDVVRKIRREYFIKSKSIAALADELQITKKIVTDVLKKITWNHVDPDKYNLPMRPRRPGDSGRSAIKDEATVQEILLRLAAGDRHIDVAKAFGVSPRAIRKIRNKKTWANVQPPPTTHQKVMDKAA